MRWSTLMAVVLVGCAGAKPAPEISDALKVPEGNALIVTLQARGSQIYACKDGSKWELKAPEAQLMDSNGGVAGKHYGGPTWEANDGSKVVGETMQRQAAPGTIPWLLLRAKSTEGAGLFSKVAFIQRLHTSGGAAPDGTCPAGSELRVEYGATYSFYGPK
jgi:hypothetical protein